MIKSPTWAVSLCTGTRCKHAAVCLHSKKSTIKIFKTIVRSNYSGTPPSTPVNTCAELHCIFSHVANILNSRPLSSRTDDTLALNANKFVKPYISNAGQEILVSNFLDEVFNDSDMDHLLQLCAPDLIPQDIFTCVSGSNPEMDHLLQTFWSKPDPPAHSSAGVATLSMAIWRFIMMKFTTWQVSLCTGIWCKLKRSSPEA